MRTKKVQRSQEERETKRESESGKGIEERRTTNIHTHATHQTRESPAAQTSSPARGLKCLERAVCSAQESWRLRGSNISVPTPDTSLSLSLSPRTPFISPGVIAAWRDRDTWPNSTTKHCTTSPYEDPNPTLVPQKESLIYANNANTIAITGNGLIDGAVLARQHDSL